MDADKGQREVAVAGGITNRGSVVRVGSEIRRPASAHSLAVSTLLTYLGSIGFPAPEFLGFDDRGRERLTYIPGEVGLPPFPRWVTSDQSLRSTAQLLRRFHDSTRGFARMSQSWGTEFSHPDGGQVIGHNDVCPENVVFRDGEAFALIDFEHAAPTHPLLDLAHTARMWIPLAAPNDPALRDGHHRRRMHALLLAYGVKTRPEAAEFSKMLDLSVIQAQAFVTERLASGRREYLDLWGQLPPDHFESQRLALQTALHGAIAS